MFKAPSRLTLIRSGFGLAAFAGHPGDGFWAVAIDLGGIGAGLALSGIFTVVLAYPAEKRVGSPIPRSADGYGGRRWPAPSAASSGWRSRSSR